MIPIPLALVMLVKRRAITWRELLKLLSGRCGDEP